MRRILRVFYDLFKFTAADEKGDPGESVGADLWAAIVLTQQASLVTTAPTFLQAQPGFGNSKSIMVVRSILANFAGGAKGSSTVACQLRSFPVAEAFLARFSTARS